MKLNIVFFGKVKNSALDSEVKRFSKVLKNSLNLIFLSDKGISYKFNDAKEKEFQILKQYFRGRQTADYYLVLLNELGIELNTSEFCSFIKDLEDKNLKYLYFIVTGPLGASVELRDFVDYTLSISQMTFTHEQALYMILEQIYRFYCFKKGIAYTK